METKFLLSNFSSKNETIFGISTWCKKFEKFTLTRRNTFLNCKGIAMKTRFIKDYRYKLEEYRVVRASHVLETVLSASYRVERTEEKSIEEQVA